jgi:UDP-N-acetylmuramoyl-tripeptide--D-alanyl-D-alanine ligase
MCPAQRIADHEVDVNTSFPSLQDIIKVTGGRLVVSQQATGLGTRPVHGISIDSRTLGAGDVFFALKGERFDGHDFVSQALSRGAVAAVVSSQWAPKQRRGEGGDGTLIVVTDPLTALQEVAADHRRRSDVVLIGVTGTNGKTTTKDMLAAVLSSRYTTLKTEGNFNNQIGVPLTLLRLRPEHRMAVVEMGMSGAGEIRRSASIGRPRHGLITNIGPAHLLQMHDLEAIAKAKFELLEMLPEDGLAFLNSDDQRLRSQRMIPPDRTVTFGMRSMADYRAEDVHFLDKEGTEFSVPGLGVFHIHTWGRHNIMNALAAIAVGKELGVEEDDIRDALADFSPSPMRMERLEIGSITIFNDAYNANPPSMRVALEVLDGTPAAGRRIAVLGDMRELGQDEIPAHREIGRWMPSLSIEELITVGELAAEMYREALAKGFSPQHARHCATLEEAAEFLKKMLRPGDVVLLKASRAIRLEKILPVLMSD